VVASCTACFARAVAEKKTHGSDHQQLTTLSADQLRVRPHHQAYAWLEKPTFFTIKIRFLGI